MPSNNSIKPSKLANRPIPGDLLPLDLTLLRPGLRLAVGLSGGADSVALLCALVARSHELGLNVHAAHLHHGLRGPEADDDLAFCAALASQLGVPFHQRHAHVATEAKTRKATIEEAAREVRYEWFRELMSTDEVDAVATAHTLDDQAETVLGKFLRGAWTEGLSGVHPTLSFAEGRVLRPLLQTTRVQVEHYLRHLPQTWREDSSNRDPAFTRNRIRHELLPLLETWNPRFKAHLAQMAETARDEDAWWQAELARLAPLLILEGKPMRGGGRGAANAASAALALDVTRITPLPTALLRRLLRHAAVRLQRRLDFDSTEALRALVLRGRAGQKLELAGGLRAERSARELRLTVSALPKAANPLANPPLADIAFPVPGEAIGFGLRVTVHAVNSDEPTKDAHLTKEARLRNWRAGDRVRLRYSKTEKKIKEVLERMNVRGAERALCPVVELDGRIIWMQGAEVDPTPSITVTSVPHEDNSA